MSSIDEPNAGQPPTGETVPPQHETPASDIPPSQADDSYTEQGAPGPVEPTKPESTTAAVVPSPASGGAIQKPPPPPPPPDDEDKEEEGMLRMSFLEHLEELRKRILLMLAG